jgi:hypothetical protein
MDTLLGGNQLRGGWLRWLVWGGALALLLAPLVAMQLGAEGVHWTAMDFVAAGILLGIAGGLYELAVWLGRDNAYVLAAGLAVGAGFVTVWANLAVGILGSENNPVNDWFFLVPALALLAAVVARFRPAGLAWAMRLAAAAQVALAIWLAVAGHGHVWVFTAVMCSAWLLSSQLFARARPR